MSPHDEKIFLAIVGQLLANVATLAEETLPKGPTLDTISKDCLDAQFILLRILSRMKAFTQEQEPNT